MMGEWVKLAELVLSLATAIAVGAMYIAVLQIRNAILTERDAMKEWVRLQLREMRADGY